MQMTPHIEAIRDDLAAAAAIGGPQSVEAAQPLLRSVEPSLRIRLLDVLSEAAAELSASLPSGHVEVRLEGRDAAFAFVAGEEAPPPATDDGATARLTLRMPESLKQRVEAAAAREGISTNSWLVRTIGQGLERRPKFGNRISGYHQS
jgi:hypothetical protein